MSVRVAERGIRAILLDIEGTTTSIAYVYEELFPFARAHLGAYLADRWGTSALDDIVRRLAIEHEADRARGEDPPPWRTDSGDVTPATIDAYARWLMDRDRKAPGLKLLQGLITDRGYEDGALHGHVYPDVAPALRRWRATGIDVAIYSSGSELAQRRLFASTSDGDLTPLIVAFFDTAVGAKREAASYHRIADALNHQPAEILFISDVTAELAAATEAGLQSVLSIRAGNAPQPGADNFTMIRSFDEVA